MGAFLVPTTVTYAALQREGVQAGMPSELVAKVGEAVRQVCLQPFSAYNRCCLSQLLLVSATAAVASHLPLAQADCTLHAVHSGG